jgi:hypothetical protein
MRDLLCHEAKLIERLLLRTSELPPDLPRAVHAIFFSEETRAGRVDINLGFTEYFEPGRESRELELVANCLTAPGVICGELCLVRNQVNNALTFMEYLGQCPHDGDYIAPYVEPVCSFVERFRGSALSDHCTQLCQELRWANVNGWRRSNDEMLLKHVRFLVCGSCAFFFFGQGAELLEQVPSQREKRDDRFGAVQFLSAGSNQVAIEGWMHVEERRDW